MRASVFLLCVVLAGCTAKPEPTTADVAGKVTNGTQPVRDAVIYFENPATAYSVWANLNENGEYRSVGLPPGKYQIAIRPRPSGSPPNEVNTEPVAPMPLTHPLVPEKFHDSNTSGLVAEVQLGPPATFDFDLAQ
ncbi:MAG: carboxypeptidase-like regulatory domain-containing protein [Gemmataceae bacterium]